MSSNLKRFIGRLLPDSLYLKYKFKKMMGYPLDLKHPKTFNEKIQWLKLYDRRPQYTLMVDKVKVKEFVAKLIGEKHIIPTLGVWENVEEIDFDTLPDQFVIKCNHNSGIGLCICRNKADINIEKVKSELKKGLSQDFYLASREWPYKNVPRRIIAEKFMSPKNESDEGNVYGKIEDLKDYKFYCFNRQPIYCQVISDRSTDEKIDFYDMNWKRIPNLVGLNQKAHNSEIDQPRPDSFEEMKLFVSRIAEKISSPFVRIDFYEIDSIPYFGEITFFPNGGYGSFRPKFWNEKLGELIKLPF